MAAELNGQILTVGEGAVGSLINYTGASVNLRGVSLEIAHCVRSSADITAEIVVNAAQIGTITIPGFGSDMNAESNAERDVARKYWLPLFRTLSAGDVLTVNLTAAAAVPVKATVYSKMPNDFLADNLKYIRPHRKTPIGNDKFPVMPTSVFAGNQIHLDPKCAPQNPSNIIRQPGTNTYYQFTSFYSIDEQHDPAGRVGNDSRIYGAKSVSPPPSSPSTSFLDNFNRPNTVPVEGGGTGTGNGWLQSQVSSFAPRTGTACIDNNGLSLYNPDHNGAVLRPGSYSDTDCSVKYVGGAGNGGVHVYACAASDFNTLYLFGVYKNGNAYLVKITNGTGATLATTARTLADGDTLRIKRAGNVLTGYVTPAGGAEVQVLTYTDTTPLAAGRAGVGADYLDCTVDDFTLAQEIIPGVQSTDEYGKPIYSWEYINGGNPIVDLIPGSADQTAGCGDPSLFIGKNGLCCMVFDTANGTEGFSNFTQTSVKIRTASTFEGLASAPSFTLYTRPRGNGNIYCPNIVYDPVSDKYLFGIDLHDEYNNRRFVGLILPNLTTAITDTDIDNAPVLTWNNEEGGNMFKRGDRIYKVTWQVPSINSPGAVQRVYSAPVADFLNPLAWRVENFNYWHNTLSDVRQDGGVTADSVFLWCDETTDELWATACTWSVTNQKNYVLWSRVQWNNLWKPSATFAVPLSMVDADVVFDIPVTETSTVRVNLNTNSSSVNLMLGATPTTDSPLSNYQIVVTFTPTVTQVYQFNAVGSPSVLATGGGAGFTISQDSVVSVKRDGNQMIVLNLAGAEVVRWTITDSNALTYLAESKSRWKLYAAGGAQIEVLEAGTLYDAASNVPPVSITSPVSGAMVTGSLPIAATVSDSTGITGLTFKIGTTTISTDSTAPYSASLDTTAFSNGDYNLTATVTDALGNTGVSAPVVITINNPDPNYVPYNDALIRRFRYFAAAPNFDKITGTIEFQDGGASFNEFSDSPLLQWQLVYQFDLRISLESAQCALMDAFFAGKRKSRSFIFNAKDGVYLDVYHASYERSHDAHKYWFQTRTIVLTKYPDETTTGTILSDAGGTVLLTDG